jgi:hypothetical protein
MLRRGKRSIKEVRSRKSSPTASKIREFGIHIHIPVKTLEIE